MPTRCYFFSSVNVINRQKTLKNSLATTMDVSFYGHYEIELCFTMTLTETPICIDDNVITEGHRTLKEVCFLICGIVYPLFSLDSRSNDLYNRAWICLEAALGFSNSRQIFLTKKLGKRYVNQF